MLAALVESSLAGPLPFIYLFTDITEMVVCVRRNGRCRSPLTGLRIAGFHYGTPIAIYPTTHINFCISMIHFYTCTLRTTVSSVRILPSAQWCRDLHCFVFVNQCLLLPSVTILSSTITSDYILRRTPKFRDPRRTTSVIMDHSHPRRGRS